MTDLSAIGKATTRPKISSILSFVSSSVNSLIGSESESCMEGSAGVFSVEVMSSSDHLWQD